MLKNKSIILFLFVIIPLVLSGQISNQTVGGWKIVETKGNVQKAYSRIVTDTTVYYNPNKDNHSQSFVGFLDNNSSITWEKKYPIAFQNVSYKSAEISVYVKKMNISAYVHLYISFGYDFEYTTFVFLAISSDMGVFYPFYFDTPINPKSVNKIKFEFVSRGTSNFEIFLDYFNIYHPYFVIDDFNDTTVPVQNGPLLPTTFRLFQNYPNPFNPSTRIKFYISSRMLVQLKVYDILGKEVVTLMNEEKYPGEYSIQFNASNLPSGIYFYQLIAGDYISTKKMQLIK